MVKVQSYGREATAAKNMMVWLIVYNFRFEVSIINIIKRNASIKFEDNQQELRQEMKGVNSLIRLAGMVVIEMGRINFSEILIKVQYFSLKKM